MFERLFAKRHIQNLDLNSIRAKLAEQLGWSREQTERVEQDYKRFLYALAHKRAGDILSPPAKEVDEFWHQHILDTRKYREDCHTIFGRYIDHTPGLSPASQRKADDCRREIYRKHNIDSITFDSKVSPSSGSDGEFVDVGGDYSTSHSTHACHDAGASGAHAHGSEAGSHSCDGGHGGGESGSGDGGDGGSGCGGGGSCGGG